MHKKESKIACNQSQIEFLFILLHRQQYFCSFIDEFNDRNHLNQWKICEKKMFHDELTRVNI